MSAVRLPVLHDNLTRVLSDGQWTSCLSPGSEHIGRELVGIVVSAHRDPGDLLHVCPRLLRATANKLVPELLDLYRGSRRLCVSLELGGSAVHTASDTPPFWVEYWFEAISVRGYATMVQSMDAFDYSETGLGL